MKQRILSTLILFFCGLALTHAQEFLLTGTITDEDSRPVIGASVLEKGTSNGTVTDSYGKFSLTLRDSLATIIVSYTGYKSWEYKLDGKERQVTISLKESASLEEVVITEYSESRLKKAMDTRLRGASAISLAPPSPPSAPPPPPSPYSMSKPAPTAPEDRFMELSISEGEYKPGSGTEAQAGTLTAGEIHDFSKWELWQDIAAEDLMNWREEWQINPAQRYPLQLTNRRGQAVVNAVVKLLDQRDQVVWQARTDNTGKAELWDNLFNAQHTPGRQLKMFVEYDGLEFLLDGISSFQQGYNFLSIPVECNTRQEIDIVFVVDATGSMEDEIDYLKAELQDVISRVKDTLPDAALNLGTVFYRDQGEEYVTRKSPLSSVINRTTAFIQEQGAQGGGDHPEAVEEALRVAVEEMDWRSEAGARLMFVVLDAPPHQSPEIRATLERVTRLAASKGIRIIPLACSGIDKSTEYPMRSLALATNGTYTFLTNDSGVGFSHIEPTTDQYDVEKLNGLLVRVIHQFAYAQSCEQTPPVVLNSPADTSNIVAAVNLPDSQQQDAEAWSLRFYPNPSSGPVNIETEGIGELFLADFSGKILERFPVNTSSSVIDIGRYPAGTYHLRFRTQNDEWMGDELVLAR